MIKNIIFDIGMVLVDFHWADTMKKLGIPDNVIDELGKNMIHNPLWSELDLGNVPEKEIIDMFKEKNKAYSSYIDLFFNNMENVVTMFYGADTFICNLKEKGYNIYLLSNYPERMFEMHKKDRFIFYPYIDGEVISFQCHLKKPDAKIYEYLLNKYKLNANECIFLDDREENIIAAKNLGMQGIVVTDPYSARNELLKVL